jgi:hypothetical protein
MKKLSVALALLILCAAVPMAQTGISETHKFPLEYRAETRTGEVAAVNEDTKEITLTCTEGDETRTFVGVLGKRYKVKIKGGSKQEVKAADLPGKRVTVAYLPQSEMDVNGVKVEANEVLLILILSNEHARPEDKKEGTITITEVFIDPSSVDLKNRRGKPEEMKGLTKVFIDSDVDLKDRERIVKEIESAKLGLTVLDSAESAEIILDFVGGERKTTVDSYNAATKIYAPLPITLAFGRGVVYVVRDGQRRAVLSFHDDGGNHFFPKKLATNFGKKFVKAYRRAHGTK